MRKLALLIAAVATLSAGLSPGEAQVGWNTGCYRWGETGYHWYNFCIGPSFVYAHRRVCELSSCWYR